MEYRPLLKRELSRELLRSTGSMGGSRRSSVSRLTSKLPSRAGSRYTVETLVDAVDSEHAFLFDRVKYAKSKAPNKSMGEEATQSITDPDAHLSLLVADPMRLRSILTLYDAVLAGPQITSYFLKGCCGVIDCPWDLFCHADVVDDLMDDLCTLLQCDVPTPTCAEGDISTFVLRVKPNRIPKQVLRENPNADLRATIAVRSRPARALSNVFNYRYTTQQCFFTGTIGVCMWPRLIRARTMRKLGGNKGTSIFPWPAGIPMTNRYDALSPAGEPSYEKPFCETIAVRAKYVQFGAPTLLSDKKYDERKQEVLQTVIAIYTKSTRYMGSVRGMT